MVTAELLLENGADPNQGNLFGRHSLMVAVSYGNERLVRTLLDPGATPTLNESSDPSALGAAAARGPVRSVPVLLKAAADPPIQEENGRTPFEDAVEGSHGEGAA